MENIPRSSNGRTTGSGPVYWGSNPYLGTFHRKQKGGRKHKGKDNVL